MILRTIGVLALCAAMLAAAGNGDATEIVSVTDELFIVHDYSSITISQEEAKSERLYAGVDQFVIATLPATEQDDVRAVATEGLRSKVQLVPRKQDANLVAQITMTQVMNNAIRNPKRVPSKGFVMLALCNYPIAGTIASDCDNLTYFYFAADKPGEIFRTVFEKWLNAKFPK